LISDAAAAAVSSAPGHQVDNAIERAPGLGVPGRELFDLHKDPHELNNLLAGELSSAEREEMQQLTQKLHDLLATHCAEGCVTTEAPKASGAASDR
jgi:hypothetical protein